MDAKKKRNKKKKANQTKHGDEASINTEEAVTQEHGNGSAASEQNKNGKILGSSEGVPPLQQDKESDKQQPSENGSINSGASLPEQDKESKKQSFQNGSASVNSAVSRVVVPEPHNKHSMCEDRLVNLHETVTKLEEEKNSWIEKVKTLEDRLSKMHDKVETYVQTEFCLEDKISKMQNTVDMHSQNESYLGRKLQILQNENDMLAKKQVSLEDKFERIEDMKYSWSQKEESLNATINWLEEANRLLQLRVKALEQSTNNTDQESRKLIENLSSVESRIEALESKSVQGSLTTEKALEQSTNNTDQESRKLIENLSSVESRIEALESKSVQGSLTTEVAKMMEETSPPAIISQPAYTKTTNQDTTHLIDPPKMVNELDIKPKETARDLGKTDLSQDRSLISTSPSVKTLQENSENLLTAVQAMQYPGTVPVTADTGNDTTITVDIDQVQKLELHLPSISEEIVHPLEDVEINEEEVASSDEMTGAVTLTDAPLIGAPFRLFSFMAKYVAGSDLVNQTSSRSGN